MTSKPGSAAMERIRDAWITEAIEQREKLLHALSVIETLTRERDEAREALKRLGSSEGMTGSFWMGNSRQAKELRARMEFARAALAGGKPE